MLTRTSIAAGTVMTKVECPSEPTRVGEDDTKCLLHTELGQVDTTVPSSTIQVDGQIKNSSDNFLMALLRALSTLAG
jgi:hypothetical protein